MPFDPDAVSRAQAGDMAARDALLAARGELDDVVERYVDERSK